MTHRKSVKDLAQLFVLLTTSTTISLLIWSGTPVTGRPEGVQSYENGRNIPEYIESSILKYCGKCSDSQKKTVEDVLLLLFSLNPEVDEPSSKFKQKLKKTLMSKKKLFKVTTSSPSDGRWQSVPAPEIAVLDFGQQHQVIAFPTISTTPSVLFPSTTVSSAPTPAQSVEMPTPPLPPTTTGPIYFYYQGLSSSSSLQPPTTSGVVESSVVEKRGTTLQP